MAHAPARLEILDDVSEPSRREPAGDSIVAGSPIFIVGSMRSGSTLLRLILDSHENIAIGAETGFMGAVSATKIIPGWIHGNEWYRRLEWTEDELDEKLRAFYTDMFGRYAASHGKRRWGDKTPFHTSHIAQMARVFPDAVFVGIVRHPGAVAVSLHRKFHYTFEAAVSYWAATNTEMVREATKLGARFVAVRYEDVVVEGEPVMRELIRWLGEPWSPRLLQHERVQREKGTPRVADGSTSTRDAIDGTRASSWPQALRSENKLTLKGIAHLAAFFGYDPLNAYDRVLLPCSDGRKWLTDGSDLLARRAAWSGRIDFEVRLQAVVADADPVQLAIRLDQVESALARVRSRKSVRLSDAIRTIQHGRSVRDVRAAYARLRGR
jgi:hypothetical protein